MIRTAKPRPYGNDRRRRRTHDPLLALSWLLETTRHAEALQVLVLSDETGLVVAGAGNHYACEELAATVAVERSLPANDTTPSRLDVLGAKTRVRQVRVDGIELLLVADTSRRETEPCLEAAASGAVRILKSRIGRSTR